mmetsp:Transcript_37785/g.46168  ORF Transcript_37785/g.46168 Transcript_37785/m.46168 type:complete len:89 (+) Transcript_37785:1-267(+)
MDVMKYRVIEAPITKFGQCNGFLRCKIQTMCFNNENLNGVLGYNGNEQTNPKKWFPTLTIPAFWRKKENTPNQKQVTRRTGVYQAVCE